MNQTFLFKDICTFRMEEGAKEHGDFSPESPWEVWIWSAIEEAADLHNYIGMAAEHNFNPVVERHMHVMINYTLIFLQPMIETIGIILVGIFNRGNETITQQILKEVGYDCGEEERTGQEDN